MSGLVRDEDSINYLKSKERIGSILTFEVEEAYSSEDKFALGRKNLVYLRIPQRDVHKNFLREIRNCLSNNLTNKPQHQRPDLKYQVKKGRNSLNYDFGQESQAFYFGVEPPLRRVMPTGQNQDS